MTEKNQKITHDILKVVAIMATVVSIGWLITVIMFSMNDAYHVSYNPQTKDEKYTKIESSVGCYQLSENFKNKRLAFLQSKGVNLALLPGNRYGYGIKNDFDVNLYEADVNNAGYYIVDETCINKLSKILKGI